MRAVVSAARGSRRLGPWARRALLALVALPLGILAVLHALGGRDAVGILSGTVPASDLGLGLGAGYALAWFGSILLAPIAGLAVLIDVAFGWVFARK